MALLERLAETHGDLAESVATIERQLQERRRAAGGLDRSTERPYRDVIALERAFTGVDLSRAAEAVLASSTPPAGIYGTGVVTEDREPRPAIFVMVELLNAARLLRTDVIPWTASEVIHGYLQDLGLELPEGTLVVGLERPEEQVAPGDPLVCLGVRGTCGIAVVASAATSAVLTAGHAARPVGSSVDDASGRIGTVAWSDSLSQHPAGAVCADAAVVELRPGFRASGGPAIVNAGVADQNDAVVAYGQNGPRSAWLRAPVIPSFALTTHEGAWKDVFLTSQAVSVKGDSGAPVVLDGTGTVVGLVVAGAGSYSLVQDISYVLSETNTSLVSTP